MWTPRHHLGELERLFVEMERRFDFLQDIDNAIVNSDEPFESKLEHLVNRFALQLIHADAVAICFPTAADTLVNPVDDTTRSDEELIPVIQQIIPAGIQPNKVMFKRIPKRIRPNTAALFLPLGTSDKDIFCVVVAMTTKISPDNSHLKNDDIIQYAARVSAQLTVLIESELRTRKTILQTQFIRSFFTSNLDRTKTLTNCLEAIRAFLPNWERHEGSNADVLVQLLTFQGLNQPLTIQAQLQANAAVTTQLIDRDVGKPVLIEDSVCGTLVHDFVKNPTIRILNIDPTRQLTSLYKAFFGRAIPKSELVAVIAEGDQLVGLLNLEHPEAKRFSPAYERLLLDAATRFAPFVRELNMALEQDRKRQSAMLYTMFGFLDRLSKTYQHKVNQLTPEIFEPWRALNKLIPKENDAARRQLDALGDKIEAYIDSTKVFVKGAPYYLSKGPLDLKRVVEGAIKEVTDPNGKIEYRFECDGRPEVYASPMLQEHIFNLLRNSQHAIQERITERDKDMTGGLVRIVAVTKKIKDHLDKDTAGGRVQISVVDNGTGVKEKDFPKIGDYDFTTKTAGTGFGLPAARDYVRSLGGEFAYRNRTDERGFVVEMFLDLFDKDRHVDETIKLKKE